MARDDHEFSAWLAARWPDLVRSLVFLGHPPEEAERIGLDALSRLLPTFERLRREDDVDVLLYREVLEEHARNPVTAAAGSAGSVEVAPGLSDQAERREELEAALALMSAEERQAVVLRRVAELSEEQLSDVLGGIGGIGGIDGIDGIAGTATDLSAEDVRFAAEAVPVPVVQPDDVRARLRARRRRAQKRGAVVVAALLVVATAVGWYAGRTDEFDGVTRTPNPLPVAWYAGGTLHLADVTVEMKDVVELVGVPDGVVASTADGDVVRVEPDGRHITIGSTVPRSPLVVEPDNGWVAWADPGVGDPQLVAYDAESDAEIGRRSLSVPGAGDAQPVGDSQALAIDGERVFYRAEDTDFAWEPLMGDAAFALAGSLVDAAQGARVSRADHGMEVQPSQFRVGAVVPAVEGELSRDGRYFFGRDDFAEMVVYDVGTGDPIDRMYAPSVEAVSWGYVDDGSFLFAVQNKVQDRRYQDLLQLPSAGDYVMLHCDPTRTRPCEVLARVPEEVQDPPVFAR